MSSGRWLFFILAALSLGSVLFFSLRPNATPLRKEFTAPLPRTVSKWIRRSYPEVRHFPAYLIFSVMTQLAVGGKTLRRTIAVLGSLLGLAMVLEVAQIWIPHREADFRDFLWSAMGVLLGSLPWILKTARPSGK